MLKIKGCCNKKAHSYVIVCEQSEDVSEEESE